MHARSCSARKHVALPMVAAVAVHVLLLSIYPTKEESKAIRRFLPTEQAKTVRWVFRVGTNGDFFFNSKDEHGHELWKSDLTAGGTRMVKDIWPGRKGSYPHHMSSFNGEIWFVANDGKHGNEIWHSDGTKSGTKMALNLNPGHKSSHASDLTACAGRLFFGALNPEHGFEMYSSDGTQEGTILLKDINPGSDDSPISQLECKISSAGEERFFFNVGTSYPGVHYMSDGTKEGTRRVPHRTRTEHSEKTEL